MNVIHLQPTQYYNKLLGITKLNTRHCRLDMHLANISEEADEIPDEAIRPSKKRRSQDEPRAARAGAQGSAQDTVDLNVSSDEEGGASSDAQSETHESWSNASSSSSPASPSGSEAESSCIPTEAGDPNVGHESGNQNFTTKDGSGTEHWHGFFPFRNFLSRWGAIGVMVECQHPCHNSTSHCSKSLQHNLVRSHDDCVMLLKLWIVRCELEPNTKEAHKAVWDPICGRSTERRTTILPSQQIWSQKAWKLWNCFKKHKSEPTILIVFFFFYFFHFDVLIKITRNARNNFL